MMSSKSEKFVRWFENLTSSDVYSVGGKNASLGEMIQTSKEVRVRIADGFATTAEAYWESVEANDLSIRIQSILDEWHSGDRSLQEGGKSIRRLFRRSNFPQEITENIKAGYR
jgi:pyruvate,water dikinase